MHQDLSYSSSSRTGGNETRRGVGEVTSPEKRQRATEEESSYGKEPMEKDPRRSRKGTFVRKQRASNQMNMDWQSQLPLGTGSRKRGTKQVWLPVPVKIVGEEISGGKRQRTNSVFDRLEDPAAASATQGRRAQ
jgi:hypothetical protein